MNRDYREPPCTSHREEFNSSFFPVIASAMSRGCSCLILCVLTAQLGYYLSISECVCKWTESTEKSVRGAAGKLFEEQPPIGRRSVLSTTCTNKGFIHRRSTFVFCGNRWARGLRPSVAAFVQREGLLIKDIGIVPNIRNPGCRRLRLSLNSTFYGPGTTHALTASFANSR